MYSPSPPPSPVIVCQPKSLREEPSEKWLGKKTVEGKQTWKKPRVNAKKNMPIDVKKIPAKEVEGEKIPFPLPPALVH